MDLFNPGRTLEGRRLQAKAEIERLTEGFGQSLAQIRVWSVEVAAARELLRVTEGCPALADERARTEERIRTLNRLIEERKRQAAEEAVLYMKLYRSLHRDTAACRRNVVKFPRRNSRLEMHANRQLPLELAAQI